MFETGKIEHILAAIDNIVNGEVNLPPGEQRKLFERIREAGKGYTIVGTKYTYNTRNQLVHRENLIRYEEYDYQYDAVGNLLTDSRSKYEWDARGHLTKVTFPDGFGEKYTYDMQGRRVTKTQFNHRWETQATTEYRYKGDTWVLTEEIHSGDEESNKSYTYDANDRPLSITFKGQTFWYVYNGHGDVMALTDKDGNVAARYEYDAWGLVTRMYNRYGERVREGIGWIGDLGSGNGSPGSLQGPEDDSGNIDPDYHPGIGNAPADSLTTDSVSAEAVFIPEIEAIGFAGKSAVPLKYVSINGKVIKSGKVVLKQDHWVFESINVLKGEKKAQDAFRFIPVVKKAPQNPWIMQPKYTNYNAEIMDEVFRLRQILIDVFDENFMN